MIRSTRLLAFGALLLTLPQLRAQSFNVDIGDQTVPFGLPGNAYGAAALQTGPWNSISPTLGAPALLTDVSNVVTAVTLGRTGGAGVFNFNDALTTGDDQSLMDDCQNVGGVASATTWTFANLAAGTYSVLTYAWAPDNAATVSTVTGGVLSGPQTCGGTWPGTHVLGTTYTAHLFSIGAGGSIAITVTTTLGSGRLGGIQLVQASPFVALCFGDGSGTPCPCGNSGAAGNGCANSINASGANLQATGNASISVDTLLLTGTGMPNASALYFSGTTVVGAGLGTPFGDGLRCAGGAVVRLGTKTNFLGTSSYPVGGDLSISVKSMVTTPTYRYYQVWYRNAAAFCTSSTFNLTETVCVLWIP